MRIDDYGLFLQSPERVGIPTPHSQHIDRQRFTGKLPSINSNTNTGLNYSITMHGEIFVVICETQASIYVGLVDVDSIYRFRLASFNLQKDSAYKQSDHTHHVLCVIYYRLLESILGAKGKAFAEVIKNHLALSGSDR